MNRDTLFNECENVIKFGENNGGYYYHPDSGSVIFFSFKHKGIQSELDNSRRRIFLSQFNIENYNGPYPLQKINSEQLFLVNTGHPEYEMLFKMTLDEKNKTIKLKLDKNPELGADLISQEEIDGLELQIL